MKIKCKLKNEYRISYLEINPCKRQSRFRESLKFRKGRIKQKPPPLSKRGSFIFIAGGLFPLPCISAVGLVRLVYCGLDFNALALSYRNPLYYLRLYMFSLSGGLLFIFTRIKHLLNNYFFYLSPI